MTLSPAWEQCNQGFQRYVTAVSLGETAPNWMANLSLVYQEFAGNLPAGLAIRDDILRDVFPGQVNHVNVATGGEVRRVTFSGDNEWQTITLE